MTCPTCGMREGACIHKAEGLVTIPVAPDGCITVEELLAPYVADPVFSGMLDDATARLSACIHQAEGQVGTANTFTNGCICRHYIGEALKIEPLCPVHSTPTRPQHADTACRNDPVSAAAGGADLIDIFDWRPIRSAPTDGTHVLVCWPSADRAYLAGFALDRWVRIGAGVIADLPQQPTHWQALPDPIRLIDSEGQS